MSEPTSIHTTEAPASAGKQISIGANNLRRVFGGGVGKLGMIIFGSAIGLMITYGSYTLFFKHKPPVVQATGSPVSAPPNRTNDPLQPVSPEEAKRRAELNAQTATQAAKSGKSFIAAPVVADASLDKRNTQNGEDGMSDAVKRMGADQGNQPGGPVVVATPGKTQGEPDQLTSQTPPQYNAAARPPQYGNGANGQARYNQSANSTPPSQSAAALDPELRKVVAKQIESIVAPQQSPPAQHVSFVTLYTAHADQNSTAKTQNGVGSGSLVTAAVATDKSEAKKKDVFITLGDTCFATLDNAIDTDDTVIVLATIHACDETSVPGTSSRLVGARVVGKIEKAQEQVRVVFNKMTLPGRTTGSVAAEAIAVTEDEARSGIGKDVDHHYFSRYFSLGLSSILTGYGKAAQQTSGTTTATGTTTVINVNPLTATQQNRIALGEMGTAFGQEVRKDFSRPVTVTAPRDMGIGVIFTNDMTLDNK
jgi:intracellular multiplication protein IcmE